jgi:hypothetical protein
MLTVEINFKQQDKIASEWLLNYQEKRKQYLEATASYCELSAAITTGLSHGNTVIKPTEKHGVALVELETQKLWLMTVEDTEKVFSDKKQAFIAFRRKARELEPSAEVGRPGWVDYVQVRYAEWHEKRYGKYVLHDKKTFSVWWNEIVNIAVRIALARKLF